MREMVPFLGILYFGIGVAAFCLIYWCCTKRQRPAQETQMWCAVFFTVYFYIPYAIGTMLDYEGILKWLLGIIVHGLVALFCGWFVYRNVGVYLRIKDKKSDGSNDE